MKKVFAFTIVLLLSIVASSQSINTVKSETVISNITVFLTGGEVTRKSNVSIKKGRNKIVFTGVSSVIDPKSIQFNANKTHELVSISTEMDYFSLQNTNPKFIKITDTINKMKDDIEVLQNEKSAYASEKKLLEKNNSIKGTQQNLTVAELKSMAYYYRERMFAINKKISAFNKRIKKTNKTINAYGNQLLELNYVENAHSNQVIAIVDSDINQSIAVELKFIVSNCGWQANYDLSAHDISGNISLKYKAKIYNNTGNNWNDVNLTLSTSDPNISASAPQLEAWYLNDKSIVNDDYSDIGYMAPQRNEYKKLYGNVSTPQQNQHIGVIGGDYQSNLNKFNRGNVKIETIEVPQLSSEFEIKNKYSIPSDSKPYLVEISKHELEVTFSHKAVPKLDKDAFLLANIVGWEKLNLISGPTNVYYANSYVGQSYINTRNVTDTLRLSFGRDTKVLVKRKKLDLFSTKSVLGGNKKDTYTYEIIVKNNQNSQLKMDLFDQIPVSQQSDITVTTIETSNADYNEDNGILKWQVNLKPGETMTYKMSFSVKYPKNKDIKVQAYRTISCPSF